MKRMLDNLRPQIEAQIKSWGSLIPESGNMVPGECLSEVTVMIRSKFRAYVQAVVDKLLENVSILQIAGVLYCILIEKRLYYAKLHIIFSCAFCI